MVVPAVLRLAIAGWVLVALGRAARTAWAHRRLLVAVWARIGVRHVAGGTVLVAATVTVANVLVTRVPGMDVGLGSLLGTTSNAVFTPLEEALARTGPAPPGGPDWVLVGLASGFLLPLLALLPWLAFVEEEVFRAGLEDASALGEIGRALTFGLVHLVVLVPLGAALAVGACGYVYGTVYRHHHAHHDGADVPVAVLRSYRPGRRAAAAASRARTPRGVLVAAGATAVADRTPERRQAAAVLASTAWHTTFNTLVVVAVWLVLLRTALDT